MTSAADASASSAISASDAANPWKSAWGRSIRIAAWLLVAVYFLLAVVVLTVRYAILPQVDRYRPDVERMASQAIGLPVTIDNIDASWSGLYPQLTMTQVKLADRRGMPVLVLPKVQAVIAWRSLAVGGLRLASLEVDAPELTVQRTREGRLVVAGLPIDFDKKGEDGQLNEWLLDQREIAVRGATVRWIDEQRGAPPLAVTDVHLSLINTGHRHRASLYARLPERLAAPLDVRADFTHPWFAANAGDPRRWEGTLYALMERADLAAWRDYVDFPVELEQGRGALRAWAKFGEGAIKEVTADLALSEVSTRLGKDLPIMRLAAVQGRIAAGWNATGHRLRLENFSLRTAAGQSVGPLDFSERYVAPGTGRKEEGEVTANGVVLHTLAEVAERLPLPVAVREMLADLKPRGRLDQLRFRWEGPLAAPLAYELHGRFDGLGLHAQPVIGLIGELPHAHPGVPGFDNLSGRIDSTHKGGSVQLRARDAALFFPGVFQEPRVPLQSLDADLKWTARTDKTPFGLRIERLAFANEHMAGSAAGSYRTGGKGPGIMDLAGRLTRADARYIYRYLPLNLSRFTRDWVEYGLLAGRAVETEFRLRGDLYDFPYKNKDGEFRVGVRFDGGKLSYVPTHDGSPSAWLPLEDVRGDLVFERTRLEVRAREARIQGVKFTNVVARIPDLSAPVLEVQGQGSGPMQDFLRYFNTAPISASVGDFTGAMRVTGNGRLGIGMKLPLADLSFTKVNGSLAFLGGDVALDAQLPPFQRVNGKLDFTETGVFLRGINAAFLGGAVKMEGGPRADGATVVQAEGTATAQGVAQLPVPALVKNMSGQMRYTASVIAKTNGGTQVQVQSDLAGMAVNLPPPLRKPAADTMAFRMDLVPGPDGNADGNPEQPLRRDELRLSIGPSVAALFERVQNETTQRMQVVRGSIGVNNPPSLPQEGVIAIVNLPVFDLDAWLKAGEGAAAAAPGAASAAASAATAAASDNTPHLDLVALRAGTMLAYGKKLQNVVVGASRDRNVWQVNLDSDQIAGYATWREATRGAPYGRLTARLAKLVIPRESSAEVTDLLESRPAQNLPGLDLVADDVNILGKPLGRLEMLADNTQRAWRIQKLQLENADGALNATGLWSPDADGRSKMALHVALDIRDAGRLLGRLGLPGTMRGGAGRLEGDISWRGAPYVLDYPSLSGQLALAIDKGQFLKADAGAAKLLGVLSMQSLPRRITLDFRDVFTEGFAYDTIRSTIQLQNGVASTQDFKMKGVQATVVIDGTSDLARETQQLKVIVVPEINAGSASVLYGLVVNPAIGFGTFLAQLLLREPLAKAFTYQYAVSGSWSDPHIAKVNREGASRNTDADNDAGG
jgi:uncharacterized protein (TIGR02099 family)